MHERTIKSFEEFWPFYVGEHADKRTRLLHFAGTTAALASAAASVLTGKKRMLLLALVAGYGPAWYSHFFVEKNKPASFKYPLYSLWADMVMWKKTLDGSMDAEVESILRRAEQSAAPDTQAETAQPNVAAPKGKPDYAVS